MIGCVKTIGKALPPFVIFQGKILVSELMTNASIRAEATMADSALPTTDAFMWFMEHFDKNASKNWGEQFAVVPHDRHSTYLISQSFVLPPDTSHVLQPLYVSCFGPFKRVNYADCGTWMRKHMGQVITRYEASGPASKACDRELTPANITSGLRKIGIYENFPANELFG